MCQIYSQLNGNLDNKVSCVYSEFIPVSANEIKNGYTAQSNGFIKVLVGTYNKSYAAISINGREVDRSGNYTGSGYISGTLSAFVKAGDVIKYMQSGTCESPSVVFFTN